MRLGPAPVLVPLLAVVAVAALTGAVAPDPAFLPFVDALAAGEPLRHPPHVAVSFGGAERRAVVDTGSTGVAVSATAIPAVNRLSVLGPGQLTYSSSGRIMVGRWVTAPLSIEGLTIGPMPVLAVDRIRCLPAARRCTPIDRPEGVAMLGIGFGRNHAPVRRDGEGWSPLDRNPLLRLRQWPAGRAPGYVVTRQGIAIGAPRDRTGFATVSLARVVDTGDWRTPPACISVGAGPPACGTVLVDTGIAGMFLTVPADRLAGVRDGPDQTRLRPGTVVSIDLTPGRPGGARHRIIVGDDRDPAAPAEAILAGIGRRSPFVNTGVTLLNRFDYLYDAEAGVVGYRARR